VSCSTVAQVCPNDRVRLQIAGLLRGLALHSLHLTGQLLESRLQILTVHARGQRDLGLPLLIHGLGKRRYLRRVRHVEHHEDRALPIISEGIEGLRLEAFNEPTVYFSPWPLLITSLAASVSKTALSIIRMTTSI
jgi:hypothetical protein